MKRARQILLGTLLLALCFSYLNCYTVLKPPRGVMSEEDRYLEEGYYDEWVSPRYLWYDPFYRWYYPDAYGRWRYYYGYPWWWNDYWYWHPHDGEEAPPEDTDRHIWDERRDPGWSSPPSAPGTPSSPSQPRQKRSEEKPKPAEDQSSEQRRTPDRQRQPDHSQPSEQKSKDSGERQEREEKD